MKQLFRGLRPDEIEVRVGTVGKKGVTLLLYKDARCDMNILDETFGPFNWGRKHEAIKNNLFCSVGIKDKDGDWVWKQDCGTESNTEKEKGEASDSFKRACFNWGIGRELYTAGLIFTSCPTEEAGGNKYKLKNQYDFYGMKVTSIEYDESTNQRTIVGLTVENKKGEKLYQRTATEDADATNTHGKEPEPKAEPKVDPKTVEAISELITLSESDIDKLLKHYKVQSLSKMTHSQGEDCKRKLNVKLDQMEAESQNEDYQQLDDVTIR